MQHPRLMIQGCRVRALEICNFCLMAIFIGHLWKNFENLLAYNSCIEGYTVIYTYVFTIYLSLIYPLYYFPSSPSPLLRIISTGFILLFSCMNTKYIHYIHPFLMPTGTHSLKRPIFPSCPSFALKVYIDSYKGVSPWYFRPVYVML
jgi:hypothetical protein